jgi:hypothetical protein
MVPWPLMAAFMLSSLRPQLNQSGPPACKDAEEVSYLVGVSSTGHDEQHPHFYYKII